jgi:NTE family protein
MSTPRIGLALGGGSARGLAHIVILEAFDEMGLKPSIIAGCSIGALVGAAYASGSSAREIRDRAEMILSNRITALRYVFGEKGTKLRDLLALRGLASLHLNGEKLAALALPDTAPELIENTAIPFKVVTTDFEARVERVIDRGRLVTAVGASIAIPGVISGPLIEGRVHVDGGVTNPVPFDHVRAGCDIVVAVDVTGRPRPPNGQPHSNMELAIGSLLIMFHQVAVLRRRQNPPDIYIEPPLGGFGAADYFRLKPLLDAALPAKDQLKRELESRIKTMR